MGNHGLEESTRSLAFAFQEADPELLQSIFLVMSLLLTNYAPVSQSHLADQLQIPEAQALTLMTRLQTAGGELDQDGNIVGFGLTLVPTAHTYIVSNRKFYVWCAYEAIIFPSIFQHTAAIESPDPISGELIQMSVSPKGIESLKPTSAVVSRRVDGLSIEDIRGTSCHYGHVFATHNTAEQYVGLRQGIDLELVSVERVFKIGQYMIRRIPTLKSISENIGRKTAG